MKRFVAIVYIFALILAVGCSEPPKGAAAPLSEEYLSANAGTIAEKTEEPKSVEEQTSLEKQVLEPPKSEAPTTKPETVEIKKGKSVTKPNLQANILFDKTIYEFGEIEEGDKIKYAFKFKNTGTGPLNIVDVQVSCGCTMPTYPIMPIGPGETGEIGVIYNSKGKFGTQKPFITVKTNATTPITKLYLSGSIKHVFENTAEKDSTDSKKQ